MEENNEKKEEVVVKETVNNNEDNKQPKKDRKGFAIAAMVLGIISIPTFFEFIISIPCAILAIIFGILAVKSSRKGLAIAGIATGATGFILTVIIYAFLFTIGFRAFDVVLDRIERGNGYNHYYNSYFHDYDDYKF